ncbi:hypothetical protein [Microlunatus sp. Gsoil 973]|uniref:hypothetical protein n=1 Tax=Microlunatus sp. Gsoil 973 TaxID=2672569 RepID=UPI0012B4E275|nr:hypothetical protein [Microlunatus sp. Gsoil 973]QGN32352.1 hypothetical protein GJV80_05600 [Microlunatus sp. Gsoil 973]
MPVRDAHTHNGGPTGRDGSQCLEEWRAVAAQLLQTNPALAWQIQLHANQPDLLDQAAHQAAESDPGQRQAVITEIINGVVDRIDPARLQPGPCAQTIWTATTQHTSTQAA